MSTLDLLERLDQGLPDMLVKENLAAFLRAHIESDGTRIELEEHSIVIPTNTPIDIVTKALFKEYFDTTEFGTYKVQVAVGGVVEQAHGVLVPKYCFATLYYTANCKLITVDFHEKFR